LARFKTWESRFYPSITADPVRHECLIGPFFLSTFLHQPLLTVLEAIWFIVFLFASLPLVLAGTFVRLSFSSCSIGLFYRMSSRFWYLMRVLCPSDMIRSAILLCFLALSTGALAFGPKLIRSAGAQSELPITTSAAVADGWMMSSGRPCDPNLGQAYNKKSPYPTKDAPITLYFASNGQLSGFGTDVFGSLPDLWVSRGYYKYVASGQYRIAVATRAANSSLCASGLPSFTEPVGDRIIINPSTIAHAVPLTDSDAQAKQWTKGACIDGMGTHWEYDLVTAPVQVC
jgi:hypothetical protein